MRRISFLLYDGALALDAVGPAEAFAMAARLPGRPADVYAVEMISAAGGPVRTASGAEIMTAPAGAAGGAPDTLIVAGGRGVEGPDPVPDAVAAIRRLAPGCRRVCSVCTGAFLLAAAGLLEGRRAVTHWASGERFRALHPAVDLDLGAIYRRDGRIWTSAGVTAGIDLALALVEEDLGRAAALEIAKQMVVFLHRPGGQAQFSRSLSAQARAAAGDPDGRFDKLHGYMADNLAADLSVAALAARAGMSVRSFSRTYAAVMGTTPAKAVERIRLEAATAALERGERSIKRVAATCGFGDDERLRRAFVRTLGVAPDAYRARFTRPSAPDPAG